MVTLKTVVKDKILLPTITTSLKGATQEEIASVLIYLKSNIYLEMFLGELKEKLSDKEFKGVLQTFGIKYNAMLQEEQRIEEIEILEEAKIPILLPGRTKNNE